MNWTNAAKRITAAWIREGRLPHKPEGRMYYYSEICCIVFKPFKDDSKLSCFYYSNPPGGGADSDYGLYYGPDIELKDVWNYLSEDEKTCIMTETLGSKKND